MDPLLVKALHLFASFVLVGFTFQAFIHPKPEARRRVMIYTGVASLAILSSGLYLGNKLGLGFPLWLIAKIGCWVALSALSGLAFRMPSIARLLSLVAIALIGFALYCVYMRPF